MDFKKNLRFPYLKKDNKTTAYLPFPIGNFRCKDVNHWIFYNFAFPALVSWNKRSAAAKDPKQHCMDKYVWYGILKLSMYFIHIFTQTYMESMSDASSALSIHPYFKYFNCFKCFLSRKVGDIF